MLGDEHLPELRNFIHGGDHGLEVPLADTGWRGAVVGFAVVGEEVSQGRGVLLAQVNACAPILLVDLPCFDIFAIVAQSKGLTLVTN